MRTIALATLLLGGLACTGCSHPPAKPKPKPNSLLHGVTSGKRWQSSIPLAPNAAAVLKAAFDTDYPPSEDRVNAYDFAAFRGDKGMDWWNFPWDLPSSQSQYQITYGDMRAMLEGVLVQPTKDATTKIRYAAMYANMVDQLTPEIMNNHGGYLRVVKIIYCTRNFLAVALKYNLALDIAPLKRAANKIIAIDATGKLLNGSSPYTSASSYHPKNVDGKLEDRTREAGVEELKALVKRD